MEDFSWGSYLVIFLQMIEDQILGDLFWLFSE